MLVPKKRKEAFNRSISLFWKGASVIDALAGAGWWIVDKWFTGLDEKILYIVWITLPLIWVFIVHRWYLKRVKILAL